MPSSTPPFCSRPRSLRCWATAQFGWRCFQALVRYPRLRIAKGVLELRTRATGELLSIELELMLRHGLSVARAVRDAAGAMPEVARLEAGAALPEVTT